MLLSCPLHWGQEDQLLVRVELQTTDLRQLDDRLYKFYSDFLLRQVRCSFLWPARAFQSGARDHGVVLAK